MRHLKWKTQAALRQPANAQDIGHQANLILTKTLIPEPKTLNPKPSVRKPVSHAILAHHLDLDHLILTTLICKLTYVNPQP